MLSAPPCSHGPGDEVGGQHADGYGPRAVRRRGPGHEPGHLAGFGTVVPQAVRAEQHPARRVEDGVEDMGTGVRRVGAEPAGDGVRVRPVLGLLPADPEGDRLGGPGVVGGELAGFAGVRQPVGAAVAHPSDDEPVRRHDAGDERRRRGVAPALPGDPPGDLGGRLVGGRPGGQEGVGDRRSPVGVRSVKGERRLGAGEQIAGRAGRGQAGEVGVRRGGHPVADDQRREGAGCRLRGHRHGVLVAGMPDPAVADGRHPGRGLVDPVVARPHRGRSALLAVPVRRDRAAAGRADDGKAVEVDRSHGHAGAHARRGWWRHGRRGRGHGHRRRRRGAARGPGSTVLGGRQLRPAALAEPLALGDGRAAARAGHEHVPGHRSVQRRTAFAWSTSRTRSSLAGVSAARSR